MFRFLLPISFASSTLSACSMYYKHSTSSSWSDMNGNREDSEKRVPLFLDFFLFSVPRVKFLHFIFIILIAANSSSFQWCRCLQREKTSPGLTLIFISMCCGSYCCCCEFFIEISRHHQKQKSLAEPLNKKKSGGKTRLGANKLLDDIKHICCHLFKSPPSLLQIVVTESSNRHRRRHSMTHWFSLYKHVTNWTTRLDA